MLDRGAGRRRRWSPSPCVGLWLRGRGRRHSLAPCGAGRVLGLRRRRSRRSSRPLVAAAAPVRDAAALATPAEGSRSVASSAVAHRASGRRSSAGDRGRRPTGAVGSRSPVLLFGDAPRRRASATSVAVRASRSVRADAGDDVAFLAVRARRGARRPPRRRRARAPRTGCATASPTWPPALPGPGAGLLPGPRDRRHLGCRRAQLDADMKTSSLSHLTAVSGSNCAVVVGLRLRGRRPLRAAAVGAGRRRAGGARRVRDPRDTRAERDPGGRDGGHRAGGRSRSRGPAAASRCCAWR